MRFSNAISFITVLYIRVLAAPSAALPERDLNSFVASEKAIALQGALNNIGPNGSVVPGAGAGFVVASPSKANPNYFYTWTRDSALTLKMVVDEFIFGNSALQPTIEAYIHAQAVLQTVSNPSGTLLPSGLGLGEPKYNVDGTRFNGAWGRPQRDGPALRATALMSYCKWLIENGEPNKARAVVWPIISNDLSYVGQYWNQTGFDLWEEISGSSFFTIQNQYRSLVEGAALANMLDVTCTSCDQAPEILCFMQSFWNGQYLVANVNANDGRSGKDANTILGPIAVFDIDAYCDSLTFQPCNSKSLANFKVLIDAFRSIYTINAGIPKNSGVAVGRYPEDTYQGGSAWYLITLAAAEFLYDAVAQWKARHNIYVDAISLPFFQDLYPAASVRKYNGGNSNSEFAQIMNAVTAYADSFVAIVEKYTPADGSLSEQFNRDTGVPLSAIDLTWSFASFITMAQRRSGQYPASWDTRNVAAPPAICAGTSTIGVYAPATAAGAPNSTVSCEVNVLFEVNATTYYGENVYLLGNVTDLGAWDLNNAQPMNPGNYSATRPLWYGSVFLPAGQTISYVYVRQENCNQPYIYMSINRTLTVPACKSPGISTNEAWVGAVGTPGSCS